MHRALRSVWPSIRRLWHSFSNCSLQQHILEYLQIQDWNQYFRRSNEHVDSWNHRVKSSQNTWHVTHPLSGVHRTLHSLQNIEHYYGDIIYSNADVTQQQYTKQKHQSSIPRNSTFLETITDPHNSINDEGFNRTPSLRETRANGLRKFQFASPPTKHRW